jgi:hypothetical protein
VSGLLAVAAAFVTALAAGRFEVARRHLEDSEYGPYEFTLGGEEMVRGTQAPRSRCPRYDVERTPAER